MSLEKLKALERKTTLDMWQRSWAYSRKGQWTRRLIPDVRRWHDKLLPNVPTTFRVTQALKGHGCFQYYLNRMRRAASAVCVQCGSAVDTVQHTLLTCVYWELYRVALADRLGHRLTVKDVSAILLGPSENEVPDDQPERGEALEFALESLKMLYKLIEDILSIKEEEERARQNGQA
uniref:Retrovirus-related Pol polyprotein from type-1 retrotransposable element R1 4 n=1 Tax=Schizaphis graminum TaxID=13262 RepID=A0A2S2NWN6_SCHGA